MADPCVVSVTGAGKKFCAMLPHSMYYGIQDVCRNMIGLSSAPSVLRSHEFWAVDHVSFSLKRGERLGLLGANGSGKSTLLRLLAGIYPPDKGRIEIRGKIGALIALGAGFHPLLTGRENIFLNGALLGMSTREIEKRLDNIVEFAGIGDFLDAPVKTYSSGMHVRLGFAVAIHAEPDLLLIDEVLAVGDASFQNRCIERVQTLNNRGTTIIFVSHSIPAVERLCLSGLFLKRGRQIFLGNIRECIQRYYDDIGQTNLGRPDQPKAIGLGQVDISDVRVYQAGGDPLNTNVELGQDFVIEFHYEFLRERSQATQVRVWLRTYEGRDVQRLMFQEEAYRDGKDYENVKIHRLKRSGTVSITVHKPRLFPQSFWVDIAIVPLDQGVHLGGLANAVLFNVIPPRSGNSYFEHGHMTVTDFDYVVALS